MATVLMLFGWAARTTPTLVGRVEFLFLEFLGELLAVSSIGICPFILIVIRAFLFTLHYCGGGLRSVQSVRGRETHFLMAASLCAIKQLTS